MAYSTSAGGVRAGRAYVELGLNTSKLAAGLATAQARVASFAAASKAALVSAFTVSAPVALVVKTFAEFDDQMRLVQAVTKSTGDQFAALSEKAKELGRTTSWTAAQVAQGMTSLGRAGFGSAEIDASIGSVMDLARATGTDISTATDIAGNALRAFNLDAAQMVRVCDVLTATANGSAQTLEDLGEAFKDVAPIAYSTGLSIEDAAKLVGSLANFGVKGSQAGTVLKAIQTRIASDAGAQSKYIELGIDTTDAEGNLRNVADVLVELGQKIQNMPSAERLATIKTLFGAYGLKGVSLTSANFTDLASAIDNASGAARNAAEAMDSGLGGAIRLTKSAIEGLSIAVGESVAPALAQFATTVQDAAGTLTKYAQTHPGAIAQVAALTVKLGAGAAALFAVSKALSLTLAGVKLLTSGYSTIIKTVDLFVGATRAAEAAQKATIATTTALSNVQKAATAVATAKTAAEKTAAQASLVLATSEYKSAAATQAAAVATARARAAVVAFTAGTVAAVAVVGALAYALNRYATAADRAASKAREAAEAAANLSQENAQRREMDQTLFDQLTELANKTQLTNEEFATAQNIVEQLESRYGALGVTCDETSRSILGLADAQNRFNAAKQAAIIADVQNEIRQRERQLDALNRVDEKYGFSTGKSTFASAVKGAKVFFGGETWEEARVRNKQERADVVGELSALRQQLAAAQNVANAQARDVAEANRPAPEPAPPTVEPYSPPPTDLNVETIAEETGDASTQAAETFAAGAGELSAALAPLEEFDALTGTLADTIETNAAASWAFDQPSILFEPFAVDFTNAVGAALDDVGATLSASWASSGTFSAFEAMDASATSQLNETRRQTRILDDLRTELRRANAAEEGDWI